MQIDTDDRTRATLDRVIAAARTAGWTTGRETISERSASRYVEMRRVSPEGGESMPVTVRVSDHAPRSSHDLIEVYVDVDACDEDIAYALEQADKELASW